MHSNQDLHATGDRAFFRIETTLRLRAVPVDPTGCDKIASEILTRIDPPLPDAEPALLGWLDRVERKLDRLLDHHGLAAQQCLDERDRHRVEISGSGLSFRSDRSFEVGSALLVEFELPEIPIRLVRALARVVLDPRATGEPLVAVAFETIRQTDRDALVRYTLAVQRQRIRSEADGDHP